MGKADLSGKRTITIYNQAWLEWLLREEAVTVEGEVSGELQFVARATDSLLRVQGESGPFLALTELQLHHDPEMPARLAAYTVLAQQKYKLDVFVTVIYLLPPPVGVTPARALHREFRGQTTHQDFQVIALWELEAREILAGGNPALLPFVPLMEGGATKEILVACAERIRQEPEALELETILAVFAGYVLSADIINQILRWEMTLFRESSIIKDLLTEERILGFQEGEQLGLQKGEQLGLQKGEQLGLQKGEQLGLLKGEQLGLQKGEQLGLQKGEQLGLQKGEQLGLLKGEQLGLLKGEQLGLQKGERIATLRLLWQILTSRFDVLPAELERRLEPLDLPTLQHLTTTALSLHTLPEFEEKLAELE
jgi:predicted transposase YdaD